MNGKLIKVAMAVSAVLSCLSPIGEAAQTLTQRVETGADGSMQSRLDALAQRAEPGVLGVSVVDLQSGAHWEVNADRAYPMMSVFKAPLGAAVLHQIERGRLSLDQSVTLTRTDLRNGASAIRDSFKGDRMSFTVRQLLVDAVSHSDNTAADALVRLIGGPQVATDFLTGHGITGMHIDMDEGTVSSIFNNLGTAGRPPAHETAAERDRRLKDGYAAYLADPRNRTTPQAAVSFLRSLWHGRLLSAESTQYLLGLLYAQTVPRRLRNGIPDGIRLADKCGTSERVAGMTAAYNDIGIITGPDGHTIVVAAFLMASHRSPRDMDAIYADLGRDVANLVQSRSESGRLPPGSREGISLGAPSQLAGFAASRPM